MYTAEDNVTVGPILYADDNLTPLALQHAEQIQPILQLLYMSNILASVG
jgi:hypothetical protein